MTRRICAYSWVTQLILAERRMPTALPRRIVVANKIAQKAQPIMGGVLISTAGSPATFMSSKLSRHMTHGMAEDSHKKQVPSECTESTSKKCTMTWLSTCLPIA